MASADQQTAGIPAPAVVPPQRVTVALLGNPNTGKTTLFNALTGLRQRVGNYPGVTVETKKGTFRHGGRTVDLIDLPGTYSLAPRSPDEMVAVDVLLGRQKGQPRPDAIVSIADASNLERNLYLTTQALELGVPVILALNMVDVAARHGVQIDAEKLGKQLGIAVVPIQANKRKGLEELREAIARATPAPGGEPAAGAGPVFPEAFQTEVASLCAAWDHSVPCFLVRRLVLDVGGYAEQRLAMERGAAVERILRDARERLANQGCSVCGMEARARYGWIRQVTAGCITRPKERPVTWTDRLDRILTHRLWGTLIFAAVMFVVFQSIFNWANPLMDYLRQGKDWLAEILRTRLPAGPFSSLLIDGVLEGVGSVLVFLPQILVLFGFIAVLEDCGYMARAAFLMDKLMARCGLSGKSFIPMLSSVACAVPGIMATRVIENRRDRLATMVVAPLMSCSARLPVYILLIGAFLTTGYPVWVPGLTLFAMYLIGVIAAPLVALLLKQTLLRGETPAFIMEMPVYKWPSLRTVLRRMSDSGTAFVRRAGTLILASMVLVWALLYFPNTDASGRGYDVGITQMRQELEGVRERLRTVSGEERGALEADIAKREQQIAELDGEWKRQSLLGRVGRTLEPAFRPLGWDWRIGTAALASFPAREVVVGTLGILYDTGKVEADEIREARAVGDTPLARQLQAASWEAHPARKVFSVPVALSLMVFFALCCQCASTLAVIRRESGSWRWPIFTFAYMTLLAYFVSMAVYQVGRLLA
jgi:ferrous iron transport protein B